MTYVTHIPLISRTAARLVISAAVIGSLWVIAASPARAALEQVGCFAGPKLGPTESCKPDPSKTFSEEIQLGGVGGMAVNYTGAGGVPAGTVYAAVRTGGPTRIAMFEPTGDGGLKFVMAWEVSIVELPYERCGPPGELPSGETVHPQCPLQVEDSTSNIDVDVHQGTGNVFVQFLVGSAPAGIKAIIEYSADGGEVITRFGEIAAGGKTTAETPSQVHAVQTPGGIAVNAAGEVFVSDINIPDNRYHRLMRFKPKTPGNLSEFEYAGTSQDVATGFLGQGPPPNQPVTDASGHIYVVAEESTIEEYDPSNPGDPAICKFNLSSGGIAGLTVNPLTESVFFFGSRIPKRVHELGPCNEATGKFEEVGQIEVKPQRDDLWALAVDPLRQFSLTRAPGILYGGAPSPKPLVGPGEPGQSSLGYIFAPLEESPPAVKSESVEKVTANSASLHAVVNPEGFKTGYVFQYMTAAAFEEGGETFEEAAKAPAGGGEVGEGKADIAVAATVLGLAPDTAYRYRVVANSKCSPGEPEKVCEVPGAIQAFRTYPLGVAGPPDHRAYELVSPADKHGGQVYPANPRVTNCAAACKPGLGVGRFPIQSSPDGNSIVYEGTSFAPGVGASNQNEYVARRTASGWQSTNPTPTLLQSRGFEDGYKVFSEGFGEAVVNQPPPVALSPEAPSEYANMYLQSLEDPLALRPFEMSQPPNRPATGGEGFVVQYGGAAADLSRVFFAANDALTEATAAAPAAVDGGPTKLNLYEWERATGELRLVNVKPGNDETEAAAKFGAGSANAISRDGSRVFWSDNSGQVYVREDAKLTIEIPDSGGFLAAAADGSKVLLNDGHIYDLESEAVTDLTGGKGGFKGIVGQSDDLTDVYFVDSEVLTAEEENSEGAKAQVGKFNLYAWNSGVTQFVATLLASDNTSIASASQGFRTDWAPVPTERTAKASPQGRYVAFLSAAPLTGYDNTGPASAHCKVIISGPPVIFGPGACSEAFIYDSADGNLTCASCNPTGATPLGWTQLATIEGPESLPQPNGITDSGRLYFDSGDSLTLSDTNDGIQDVYQWEPEGLGTCKREGGCISLISAGRESVESNFVDADDTGKNVFFTTRDQLVLKDKDELIDLYDAREFGGIAAETETTRSECQGEACQPAPNVPANPTPASSGFQGKGNVKQGGIKPRCPKGKRAVRKRGKSRCVKRNRNRARAANRNRGGAK